MRGHTHERSGASSITGVHENTRTFQEGESLFDRADGASKGERGQAVSGGYGGVEDVER